MIRSPQVTRKTLIFLGLVSSLACGGGGGGGTSPSPTPVPPVNKTIADTLGYTNPTSGTYQLVKNVSKSSSGHLVLDLVGPSRNVSGVGFYLTIDPTKVAWSTVDPTDPELVRSAAFSNIIIKAKVTGGSLQAGIYQKGLTSALSATTTTVLASVALDIKSNVVISNPPTISFSSGKALILNDPANPSTTNPITISVGTLTAN